MSEINEALFYRLQQQNGSQQQFRSGEQSDWATNPFTKGALSPEEAEAMYGLKVERTNDEEAIEQTPEEAENMVENNQEINVDILPIGNMPTNETPSTGVIVMPESPVGHQEPEGTSTSDIAIPPLFETTTPDTTTTPPGLTLPEETIPPTDIITQPEVTPLPGGPEPGVIIGEPEPGVTPEILEPGAVIVEPEPVTTPEILEPGVTPETPDPGVRPEEPDPGIKPEEPDPGVRPEEPDPGTRPEEPDPGNVSGETPPPDTNNPIGTTNPTETPAATNPVNPTDTTEAANTTESTGAAATTGAINDQTDVINVAETVIPVYQAVPSYEFVAPNGTMGNFEEMSTSADSEDLESEKELPGKTELQSASKATSKKPTSAPIDTIAVSSDTSTTAQQQHQEALQVKAEEDKNNFKHKAHAKTAESLGGEKNERELEDEINATIRKQSNEEKSKSRFEDKAATSINASQNTQFLAIGGYRYSDYDKLDEMRDKKSQKQHQQQRQKPQAKIKKLKKQGESEQQDPQHNQAIFHNSASRLDFMS